MATGTYGSWAYGNQANVPGGSQYLAYRPGVGYVRPTGNPMQAKGYVRDARGNLVYSAAAAAGRPGGLAGQYQSAYDEAKAANEQRYQQVLAGYQQRQQQAMTALAGLGEAERARLLKQYGEASSRQRAGLVGRGLGGTSVASDVEAKMMREQTDALGGLEERLRREQLGYQTGLSGDTLGFMERREDQYPDLQQMLMLAQLQGKYGGGGAGAGTGALPGYREAIPSPVYPGKALPLQQYGNMMLANLGR